MDPKKINQQHGVETHVDTWKESQIKVFPGSQLEHENNFIKTELVKDMEQISKNLNQVFLKTPQLQEVKKYIGKIEAVVLRHLSGGVEHTRKLVDVPGFGGSLYVWTMKQTRFSYDEHVGIAINPTCMFPVLQTLAKFRLAFNDGYHPVLLKKRSPIQLTMQYFGDDEKELIVTHVNNEPVEKFLKNFREWAGYDTYETHAHLVAKLLSIYNPHNPIKSVRFEHQKKSIPVKYEYVVLKYCCFDFHSQDQRNHTTNNKETELISDIFTHLQEENTQQAIKPHSDMIRVFPARNTVYCRIPNFVFTKEEFFEMMGDLESLSDYEYFVLDLRGNAGGFVYQYELFLAAFGIELRERKIRKLTTESSISAQIKDKAMSEIYNTIENYLSNQKKPSVTVGYELEVPADVNFEFDGVVILITDHVCYSSCIHFVNNMSALFPKIVHIGKQVTATGGEGDEECLPLESGLASFCFGTAEIKYSNYIKKKLEPDVLLPDFVLHDNELLLFTVFDLMVDGTISKIIRSGEHSKKESRK